MVTSIPSGNRTAYKQGSGNNFSGYPDQCTWWAAERYHQLTGIWVPWIGNAYQWAANAQSSGWVVSDQPPKGIPSIICLQGYAGQGLLASGTQYGHVGIVEGINNDGSVRTSDENWTVGPILGYVGSGNWPIRQVTFHTGYGVSFIYATSDAGTIPTTNLPTISKVVQMANLSPNSDVTQFLVEMDVFLQVVNPFDDTGVKQDNIAGVTFDDPVDYLSKVFSNLYVSTRAISMRSILIFLGFFLLYKVLAHFVDFAGVVKQAGQTTSRIISMASGNGGSQ